MPDAYECGALCQEVDGVRVRFHPHRRLKEGDGRMKDREVRKGGREGKMGRKVRKGR